MIKLIAFDWNGTLLADTKFVAQATDMAFKHFGYKPIGLKKYRQTFSIPVLNFWLANGGKKEDLLLEHNIFFHAYEKLLKDAHPRFGAKEVLKWVKQNDIESIIYSNHTFKEIHFQLKRFGLSPYIQEVLSRKDVSDQVHLLKRHKEDKLANYIKIHKFKPREVISVGDTCEEVEIGHNLNLHTVAITGGENTTQRLKKTKPDFLIHNMLELKKIVKELN
jgi:phosphoglycolate phosphatase